MSGSTRSAGGAIVVREFTGSGAEWNAFVESVPNGSTFHRWEWREVYRAEYGHETPYLAAYDGSTIVGVLPLVRVRSLLFGHYLVSLPFVSYPGPVGTPAAERALCDHAVAIADGAKLVELRCRAPIETTLTPVSRKIIVLRDLVPGDYDATFKAFDSKLRSQVRRAEREGVVVRFGREQIGAYHRVFSEHMRDLGSPAHSERFFARLADALSERAWIGVAYLGDEPIAGGFAIVDRYEIEMAWASALRRHAKIAPNMALYGAFIRRSCEEGKQVFNFGRCTPGSGTHKFKQQWGSRDVPLLWYQHSAAGVASTPAPDQGAYGTAVRVWQKLPIALTRVVGPALIRGIP